MATGVLVSVCECVGQYVCNCECVGACARVYGYVCTGMCAIVLA
jgi:hypothetical protein